MIFLARYFHRGMVWGVCFPADSWDDAFDFCRMHGWRLDGKHCETYTRKQLIEINTAMVEGACSTKH